MNLGMIEGFSWLEKSSQAGELFLRSLIQMVATCGYTPTKAGRTKLIEIMSDIMAMFNIEYLYNIRIYIYTHDIHIHRYRYIYHLLGFIWAYVHIYIYHTYQNLSSYPCSPWMIQGTPNIKTNAPGLELEWLIWSVSMGACQDQVDWI